jgi:ribosome-interacting GTPase 1
MCSRESVFRLTGLIRVYLSKGGAVDGEPLALRKGATILEVADAIHHELAESCAGANVWGPSARFPGQRVGREHEVLDGDAVEILT